MVIVHSDTEAHKFDDELSQIHVAFVKGLKRSAVLVKTFLNSDRNDSKTTVTQTPQGTRPFQEARTRGDFEVPGEAAWVRPPNLQRVVASSCWTLATVRGQGLPA